MIDRSRRLRIAVISPFINGYYLGEIVDHLRLVSIEKDFDLVAIETRSFNTYDLTLSLNKIDGIILLINSINQTLAKEIIRREIPVISMGFDYFPAKIESIQVDNRDGIYQAMTHLKELGHEHIGFAGDVSIHDFSCRYKAYMQFLYEKHMPSDGSMIFDVSGNNLHCGSIVAEEFIERKKPCSAMVFATDLMAVGFQNKMIKMGYKVPEDVAIVGFDNTVPTKTANPKITTVDQNLEGIAKYLANRILEKIAGSPNRFNGVHLPCNLIKRGSTIEVDAHEPIFDIQDKNTTSIKIIEGVVAQDFESMKSLILHHHQGNTGLSNAFGSFFNFACIAKWKDNIDPDILILDDFIDDISNNQYLNSVGDEINQDDFPLENMFNIGKNNHIISIFPMMFKNRLWGLFAISGDGDNRDPFASYQIFANHMEVLVSIMEKEKLLDIVIQKEESSKTIADELKIISNNTTDGIWIWDYKTNLFEWNTKALNMLGYQNEIDIKSMKNIPIYEIAHPDDIDKVKNRINGLITNNKSFNFEFRLSNKSDNYIWINSSAEAIFDENNLPSRIIGTISDISEKHENIKKIQYMSYYDELTGLPNRSMMRLKLETYIEGNKNIELAILLLDLDRFKILNDSYGHIAGDRYLIHISNEISKVLRDVDFLSRIGGDEFVIMCPVNKDEEALQISKRILDIIEQPYNDETGFEFHLSGSIGITYYPGDGKTSQKLIKNADIAMYQSKKLGRNCITVFKDDMDKTFQGKVNMETYLRKAIKENEFEIFIQPQFNMQNGKLTGGEVLLRWFSKDLGPIPPMQFIELAEETDLIIPIGAWVFNESCRVLSGFQKEYGKDIELSVNVSAAQILRGDFIKVVKRAIEMHNIDPKGICVEITESMAINNIEHTILVLNELKDIGIKISLDDFGTGYSSLSVLKELPLDELKIDKSFLPLNNELGEDWIIIEAIIKMGHALNIRIVTEGIETLEQLSVLKLMGCDIAQGYYFGRPGPVKNFIHLLKNTEPGVT